MSSQLPDSTQTSVDQSSQDLAPSSESNETDAHPPNQQELRVYSRRQRNNQTMNPQHSQEANPMVDPLPLDESGNNHSNTDLDIPIALRKGIRSCTQHPISKFISYSKLSSSFKTFTSSLSDVFIPRNIEEALKIH